MNRSFLNYLIGRTSHNVGDFRIWFLDEARMYHGEKPLPSTVTRESVEECYRLWGWILLRWREYLRILKEIQQEPEDEAIRHLERYKVVLKQMRDLQTVRERRGFVDVRMKEIERILEKHAGKTLHPGL